MASKLIHTDKIHGNCPYCQKDNSLIVEVYLNYWAYKSFSIIPIGKIFKISCNNCFNNISINTLDDNAKRSLSLLKKDVKTPLWSYMWLFILIILVFCSVLFIQYNKNRKAEWINNPMKGDVYEIREAKNTYTLFKVVDVKRDTLYMIVNDFTTDKISGIDDLFTKPYGRDTVLYSKDDILRFMEDGHLFEIHRDK